METWQTLVFATVVFPALLVTGVVIFVWASRRYAQSKEVLQRQKDEMIGTMKLVIKNYEELVKTYRDKVR